MQPADKPCLKQAVQVTLFTSWVLEILKHNIVGINSESQEQNKKKKGDQ